MVDSLFDLTAFFIKRRLIRSNLNGQGYLVKLKALPDSILDQIDQLPSERLYLLYHDICFGSSSHALVKISSELKECTQYYRLPLKVQFPFKFYANSFRDREDYCFHKVSLTSFEGAQEYQIKNGESIEICSGY